MRRGSRDGDPPSRSGGLSASLARADASGDAERAYGRSSSYGAGPVPRASSSGADRGPEHEESPRAKRERWGATYRSPYAQSAGMDIPSAGASRRSRIGAAPAYDSATRSYGRDHYASRAEAQPRSFSRAPISPSSDDRPAGLPSRRALDRRASTDLGSSPTTTFERHDAQRRRDAEARDADVIARALGRASVVESRPLASRRDDDDDARVNIFGHDHRAHPGHPSASSAPSRVGSSSAERRARLLDRARRVAADRSTPDPAAGSGRSFGDARFFSGGDDVDARARGGPGDGSFGVGDYGASLVFPDSRRLRDAPSSPPGAGGSLSGFSLDLDEIDARRRELARRKAATLAAVANPEPKAREVKMFDRPRGLRGLSNLGNTCFIASCVQCLAHAPPTARYFLDDAKSGDDENGRASASGPARVLAPATERLVRAIHAGGDHAGPGGRGAHAPKDFLRAMDRAPPLDLFADGDQHDSQEFLRYLLDRLNDELNVVRVAPPYVEEKDDFTERESDKAERLWAKYKARTSSVVADAFAGQLQSLVTCDACGKASSSYDPFWDLSLPLRRAGEPDAAPPSRAGSLIRYVAGGGATSEPLDVRDCLEAFAEDERLSGQNAFRCPRCKAVGGATKRLRIKRWPRVLVLHLKRFSWNERGRPGRKIDRAVDVPGDIELRDVLCAEERASHAPVRYGLFGVIDHSGSLSGGHYTATCDAGGGEWYRFDDETVTRTKGAPKSSRHAYVLMYALKSR